MLAELILCFTTAEARAKIWSFKLIEAPGGFHFCPV